MPDQAGEVNFFGVKIKVKNPTLASLLNSDVTDDVVVVARRALREGRHEGGAAGAADAGPDGLEEPAAGEPEHGDRVSPLPPEWLDLRLDRDRADWQRNAESLSAATNSDDPLAGLAATPETPPEEQRK
jgi:hypothetical protein